MKLYDVSSLSNKYFQQYIFQYFWYIYIFHDKLLKIIKILSHYFYYIWSSPYYVADFMKFHYLKKKKLIYSHALSEAKEKTRRRYLISILKKKIADDEIASDRK